MSFEQKSTWVSLAVSILVTAAYAITVSGSLTTVPVAEIAYQRPMLLCVGATIVVNIVGNILMAIGSAVSATIRGEKNVDDIDRKDERDVGIGRRGELVGYYASSVGILGALALAMLRADHFWIANAIFLSLMIGGVASSVAKLISYRRGY